LGIVAIGTVRGSEITENKDADEKSRLLQVEFTNADDLQTIEQLGATGEDSNPQPGARVIVIDLGPSYRVAVALSDELEPEVKAGEKEIYSYDDAGAKLATIKLLGDSSIELNGDADNAVAFADLKTAFNQVKSDLDAAIDRINAVTALLRSWVVVANDGGGALQLQAGIDFVLDVPNSTADIDPAKIDSIKVP